MSKKNIDVALFIRSFHGGGAEKAMLYLAQNFIERGLKVDLLLPRAEGQFLEQVPPEVRLIDLKSRWVPASIPKLVRYLRTNCPQTLLAALHYPAEIAILAKYLARSKTRVIVSEQNTLSFEAKNIKQLSVRLNPLGAKLFYPWADGITAVSQGVAKDLARVAAIPLERIDVIYNPVFYPEIVVKSQETVDHPWLQPGEPPVIVGAGRLHPQKDFPTLIRAFERVRRVQPARLMILGIGPQEAELRALTRELGIDSEVVFPGFVQNPYKYMAQAAVFVLSSAWEGFGNVLVEAMGVGTPIVSTNCPGGPAEVLGHGKYGWLTPVGDSEAVARAILKVLGGEVKPVNSQWLEQFTLETCSQKYLEVLGLNSAPVSQAITI